MNYPEEYKQKVLKIFPDNQAVKTVLDYGNEILGRMLSDHIRSLSISPNEVIEAYQNREKMELLYQKSLRIIEIQKLYSEYFEICRSEQKHH